MSRQRALRLICATWKDPRCGCGAYLREVEVMVMGGGGCWAHCIRCPWVYPVWPICPVGGGGIKGVWTRGIDATKKNDEAR